MKKTLEKHYEVFIDGIDKSGKDSLARYIDKYCGYTLCVHSRGMLSTIAYNILYGREVDYQNFRGNPCQPLYVLLKVDKKDWEMRCQLTSEPAISYEKNVEVFDRAEEIVKQLGYKVIEFNTTQYTLDTIAKAVVGYIETENSIKLMEDK